MSNETAGKDVLADEKKLYIPPRDLVENSNVMQWMQKKGFQTEAEMRAWTGENYVEFWDEMAKTYADWFEPYKATLEWKPPYAKWFVGGKCNVAYNAVERHANSCRRNKVAYIFVGEPVGDVRKITYFELNRETNKFANALKSAGVKKGDRVGIYLPMILELPIAMLACAKIGAIHVVVFSGFSAVAVRDRLKDCEPKVLVTCDGSYRRGKPIMTKGQADEAIMGIKSIERVVVVKRNGQEIPMNEGRDVWWDDFVKNQSGSCKAMSMDPEDPLFILYTAGTAGKPLWWRRYVGNGFAPIMDTWFQSETGSQVIAPLPITPLKPGSPSFALPGYNVEVVDDAGKPVAADTPGNVVLTEPWPSMLRTVYKDPAMYRETYWSTFPGKYLSGDKARVDSDGYIWAMGRADDVLKVAGHRISNAEVEASVEKHPAVAHAAVIGKPDKVKGENIVVFAILKLGFNGDANMQKDIKNFVRKTLGPIAIPSDVIFVKDFPKNKAGKPARNLIKAKALGQNLGETSAVSNPDAITDIPLISK